MDHIRYTFLVPVQEREGLAPDVRVRRLGRVRRAAVLTCLSLCPEGGSSLLAHPECHQDELHLHTPSASSLLASVIRKCTDLGMVKGGIGACLACLAAAVSCPHT